MIDLGDNMLATLIVAQLVVLPILTAMAALLVRRHPARAHTVITAGLIATLVAPLLSLAAAAGGLGLLPGLELTPSAPVAAAIESSDDAARNAPVLGPVGLIVIGWALATAVLLVRLAVGLHRGFSIAKTAHACDDEHAAGILRRITAHDARRAVLCRTQRIESPAIFCWCRAPRILLPQALAIDTDPHMLEQMLTHEVAHLTRRDHWWRLVAELAACLLPWHPIVWSLRRAVYETSEMACDARVLRGDDHPERYAETLLQLTPCRTVQLPALHAVRSTTKLTRRIRAILRPERTSDRSGGTALAMIVIGAIAITTAAALAQRRPVVVTPATNAPTPLIAIEAVPNELDLGLVAPGGSAEGFIRLVNVGSMPVTIAGQKASCGCTTIEPIEGNTLAPGATLKVPIKLAAPDTPDTERRRKVTFLFEELDPIEAHVRLHTTGP